MRLDFSKAEITEIIKDQLKAWKVGVEQSRNETKEFESE
jgi:hypothetical protein